MSPPSSPVHRDHKRCFRQVDLSLISLRAVRAKQSITKQRTKSLYFQCRAMRS